MGGLREGHKQKITNKAGTVTASVKEVKEVKQGIFNRTNVMYCPRTSPQDLNSIKSYSVQLAGVCQAVQNVTPGVLLLCKLL